MAFAVIAEATLSFLGLGASPPTPTLGNILATGRSWLLSVGAWWFVFFPTLGLALILLSLNFLADAQWSRRSTRTAGIGRAYAGRAQRKPTLPVLVSGGRPIRAAGR